MISITIMFGQSEFKAILESIPLRFNPDRIKGKEMRVLFEFTDETDQSFVVAIDNGNCNVMQAIGQHEYDCKVKSTLSDYVALEMGRLSPQEALMSSRLQISDIEVMLEFSKAFTSFTQFENNRSSESSNSRKPEKRPFKHGPLMDVLVLDFTKLLPGPLCTRVLADRGAYVVKIEDPNSPDSIRGFPPFEGEQSLFYKVLNRNKKSLEIPFQKESEKTTLMEMIESADVLIEQFRPGVMKAFGLDYDSLKAINPALIYVSITGYGQDGKYASEPGHDINYMARSGVLSQIKDWEGNPFVPAIQIADIFGGSMQAVQEILFALLERNQSGKGQHIDINMSGGVTPLLTLVATHFQGTKDENSFVLNGQHINYSVYQSMDGDYFALGALEPKFWNRFCEHIEKEEWKGRLLSNDAKHRDELINLFKSKESDFWRAIESKGDACLTEVLDLNTAISKFPEFWSSTKGGVRFPGNPEFNFWESPELGEDN